MSNAQPLSAAAEGLLMAVNDVVALDCIGYGTVAFELSGTWIGTVTFQATNGGGTWQTLNVTKTNASSQVTSATTNGLWTGACAALVQVRALCSAFTPTGPIRVKIVASPTGGGGAGGGGGGGGGAVTIGDGDDQAEGATTDAAATNSTDPWSVVALLKGIWALLNAGGGGGAVTIADGDDVAEGATTDAKVTSDSDGTVSAKLRGMVTILGDVWDSVSHVVKVSVTQPLPAGTNAIGTLAANSGVDIGDVDVTSCALPTGAATEATLSTLNGKVTAVNTGAVVVSSSALPSGASTLAEQQSQTTVLGATNGAAVITDANGTIQQYLRGLVKLLITSGTIVLGAGTAAIGKLAANSGVDIGDVDVTSVAAGSNLIGDVGIQPRATNGLSTMNATSSDGATALTNSAQAIKASAGKLYGYYIYNPNAVAAYVQFYNTAAGSVTVGTTTPLFMLTIPPLSAANLLNDIGITFSNAGWSWSATSTAGGNGAPSTALDAVAWYA